MFKAKTLISRKLGTVQGAIPSSLTIVFLSVQLMPLVEYPLILRKERRWYGGRSARAYCTASGAMLSRSFPMFTHLQMVSESDHLSHATLASNI